jgi:CRP/FNR family transcriptional regulator
MDTRIAQFLLEHCPHDGASLNLTHEKFALELGTNRVVVSRILEAFKEEGLLNLARGCITVLRTSGLAKK